MHNYYKTLGVSRTASAQEIKLAYRALAKKYHPDKNRTKIAEALFKEINRAYQVLADPKKKADYDLSFTTIGIKRGIRVKTTSYSEKVKKQGKYFVIGLMISVLIIPILLLRFSSSYNYKKGLDYYEVGDVSKALLYFQKSVTELGAKKKEASLKAIAICYEAGFIAQGIAFAQEGSRYLFKNVNKGNLSYREGLGWEMLKRYTLADQAFKKALEMGYQNDSVFIHLGMLHGFELGNYEEALTYFSYLVNDVKLPAFKLQRGIVLENSGNYKSAIEDLQWYTLNYPENATGHFFLGASLVVTGDTITACTSFQTAKQLGLQESDSYLQLYCN